MSFISFHAPNGVSRWLVGPGFESSGHAIDLFESILREVFGGTTAGDTVVAVNNQGFFFVGGFDVLLSLIHI